MHRNAKGLMKGEANVKKRLSDCLFTIASLIIPLLLITVSADARIVSVQMSAPTIAFGGYSWPGVGQYEKITGVAYAEVDPADRRNSIIVDIARAQTQAAPGHPGKTPSGKVAYLLNFYILKPVNLNQVDRKLNGYGKVMYEPPNRGNKTWIALGRVTVDQGGNGNDPGVSITDPTVLANSFSDAARIYTGLERVGTTGSIPCKPQYHVDPSCSITDREKCRRLDDHRSSVRIYRNHGQLIHAKLPRGRHDGQNHSGANPPRSS